jgi:uncharacterized protein (DUF934 family)
MPLVKAGRVVEDPYTRVIGDAPIPQGVPVIVEANRFLAEAERLLSRQAPVGVLWPNDSRVAALAPWLDRLALVALVFPKFRDGRAYSQARLLRERHGFRGELRATGDVLRDQFLFLIRAGFDALEVKKPADAAAFAETIGRHSVFYQQSANGWTPAARQRLLRAAAGQGSLDHSGAGEASGLSFSTT